MEQTRTAKETTTRESLATKFSKYFEHSGHLNGLGGCCFHLGIVHEECCAETHKKVSEILKVINSKVGEMEPSEMKKSKKAIAKFNICAKECDFPEFNA